MSPRCRSEDYSTIEFAAIELFWKGCAFTPRKCFAEEAKEVQK